MTSVFVAGPLPGKSLPWLKSRGISVDVFEKGLPAAASRQELVTVFGEEMVVLYGEQKLSKQLQLSNVKPISQEELAEKISSGKYEVIMPWLTTPITKEMIAKAHPKLRAINCYSVGFDHLDYKACEDAGIVATHTRNVLHFSVAEHAMTLMLALVRRIAYQDWFFRKKLVKGRWHSEFFNYGRSGDLFRRTLGIIGFGQIGKEVYKRAKAFEMNVVAYDPVLGPEHRQQYKDVEFFDTLHECLEKADIVTLHMPYIADGPYKTHKLIGKKELELIGKEGYLINTARGRIIDEDALVEALKNKTIAGAALDVFYDEPDARELLYHARENTLLVPHTASVGSSREDGQVEDFDLITENTEKLRKGFNDGSIILGMASLTVLNTYLILKGEEPLSLIPGLNWATIRQNREKLNKSQFSSLLS